MKPSDEPSVETASSTSAPPARTRIALTGASGFIGRRVLHALLARGLHVRALYRRPPRPPVAPALEPVIGNMGDEASLRELLAGADAVINCAGSVRGARAADFDPVNVCGLQRLAAALRAVSPHARLVQLSSLAARAPALSDYAASKWRAEQYLQHECPDIAWLVLRPPAVYGPGDTEVLPLFRAMRRGYLPTVAPPDARLSLVFVDDLAAALAACAGGAGAPGEVLALHDGTPGGYDWPGIAATGEAVFGRRVRLLRLPLPLLAGLATTNRMLAGVVGYAPMLTPGKVAELRNPDWVCDNTGITESTGWTPQVRLAEGIRLTLAP